MSFSALVKNQIERLPETWGRPLVHVPFVFRLGIGYSRAVQAIADAERAPPSPLDAQRFAQLRSLLQAAVEQVEFYRTFYRSKGFSPDDLRSWDDWKRVPVVTKTDLQGVPLAARTSRGAKGLKINTGGTSGQPLEFYLDAQAFAREWAHMHYLWQAHGYRPRHLKLTFRGKHFESRQPLRFNAVHNEFIVNANASMPEVIKAVAALTRSTVIRWVHGYPSLVAEFSHAYADLSCGELAAFRSRLFGVLLGSEYPATAYRSLIENLLSSNVVTWYGHSEMALLARETAKGIYESLPTYGYAEAVPSDEHSSDCRLVSTSLHNRVHPFIRYDTGDLIEPLSERNGSLAFRITEGRVGDFILDRQGMRHSLTAIIFGRHHAAFERLQHIQVREEQPGCVTLVLTPRSQCMDRGALSQGFDLGDLDIEWRMEFVDAPVRTPTGKIRLKIS